jgi:hypothetical protein
MLHVGPLMIPEQHRRLIGNDICVIIFYEHNDDKYEPFNTEALTQIGTVPQVSFLLFTRFTRAIFLFSTFVITCLKIIDNVVLINYT